MSTTLVYGNDIVNIVFQIIDSTTQSRQIIFYDIPYQIRINIKIAMSYVISHTLYSLPWNLWPCRQQLTFRTFIYAFHALTYCLYKHTICSKSLHTAW